MVSLANGLRYFRIPPLGAWCLGIEESYEPAAPGPKPVRELLANGDIVGLALEQSDWLALNSRAVSAADSVWKLEGVKLLAAIDAGRSVNDSRDYLKARSGQDLRTW